MCYQHLNDLWIILGFRSEKNILKFFAALQQVSASEDGNSLHYILLTALFISRQVEVMKIIVPDFSTSIMHQTMNESEKKVHLDFFVLILFIYFFHADDIFKSILPKIF